MEPRTESLLSVSDKEADPVADVLMSIEVRAGAW